MYYSLHPMAVVKPRSFRRPPEETHVLLATAYYRLKRKDDGDRERAEVARLTAANQARQPGAKAADQPPAPEAQHPQGTTGQ